MWWGGYPPTPFPALLPQARTHLHPDAAPPPLSPLRPLSPWPPPLPRRPSPCPPLSPCQALIPLALLAVCEVPSASDFLLLSTAAHYGLFPLLHGPQEYLPKLLLTLIYLGVSYRWVEGKAEAETGRGAGGVGVGGKAEEAETGRGAGVAGWGWQGGGGRVGVAG